MENYVIVYCINSEYNSVLIGEMFAASVDVALTFKDGRLCFAQAIDRSLQELMGKLKRLVVDIRPMRSVSAISVYHLRNAASSYVHKVDLYGNESVFNEQVVNTTDPQIKIMEHKRLILSMLNSA